jgi:hypothetical protein
METQPAWWEVGQRRRPNARARVRRRLRHAPPADTNDHTTHRGVLCETPGCGLRAQGPGLCLHGGREEGLRVGCRIADGCMRACVTLASAPLGRAWWCREPANDTPLCAGHTHLLALGQLLAPGLAAGACCLEVEGRGALPRRHDCAREDLEGADVDLRSVARDRCVLSGRAATKLERLVGRLRGARPARCMHAAHAAEAHRHAVWSKARSAGLPPHTALASQQQLGQDRMRLPCAAALPHSASGPPSRHPHPHTTCTHLRPAASHQTCNCACSGGA